MSDKTDARSHSTLPPPEPATLAQRLRALATEARLRARIEERTARDLDAAAAMQESRRRAG